MLDLSLTPEQEQFIDVVRSVAEKELRPVARMSDDERTLPGRVLDQIRELGLTMPIPEEDGGSGLTDSVTFVSAAEALAYGDPALALAGLGQGLAAMFVDRCAAQGQRDELLGAASDRDAPASLALYEGFGRQPAEFRTTCRRVGSGWRIEGRKDSVLNPGTAGLNVLVARDVESDVLRAFAFVGTRDGITIERDDRLEGTLALGAASIGAVVYQDVSLDAGTLLTGDDATVRRAIAWARLLVPALSLGTSMAAYDYASEYAGQRVAFGKPITANQAISFMLVDLYMAAESARLCLRQAAWSVDTSHDLEEVESLVRRVVARGTELGVRAGRDAVQVLGGHGFMRDHPVERWYRATARLSAIDFDPLEVDLGVV